MNEDLDDSANQPITGQPRPDEVVVDGAESARRLIDPNDIGEIGDIALPDMIVPVDEHPEAEQSGVAEKGSSSIADRLRSAASTLGSFFKLPDTDSYSSPLTKGGNLAIKASSLLMFVAASKYGGAEAAPGIMQGMFAVLGVAGFGAAAFHTKLEDSWVRDRNESRRA